MAAIVGGIYNLTGTIKWSKWTENQSIDSSYSELFSISGSGGFYGGIFNVSSNDIDIKIEADNNEILELNLTDLSDNFDLRSNAGNGNNEVWMPGSKTPYLGEYTSKHWRFEPPEPLMFTGSLKIKMKKSSGSDKTIYRGISTWKGA